VASKLDKKDLHADSLKEFQAGSTGWEDIYKEGLEDLHFVKGNQWPEEIKSQRLEQGRPILTINKLWKFTKNVIGDQKQNRPQIKVLPSDSKADITTAQILNDIIRHIEYKSEAPMIYDTGFNQCLTSSIGFWRVISKYEDGLTFDQCLRIELIPNQFSVLFDPKAKDPMLTDARYCFISTWMSRDEFEDKYPKADTSSWPSESSQDLHAGWWEDDKVRVAEKYYFVPRKVKIAQLNTGEIIEINDETREYLLEQGFTIEKERTAEKRELWWCKMNGHEVIDGPYKQPGKYIPVVPVLGDMLDVEGKRTIFSLIRHAKDPQRMYNYHASTATETVGLQPKAPWIVTADQIQGYEKYWREAGKGIKPFLPYNFIPGQPTPTRVSPPTVPTGAFAETEKADRQIYETIGMTPPSLGEPSNERSGKALAMRQRSADKSVYSFFDNHSRAIAHTGKILVDLIPHYYDTERIIKIQGDDGQLKQLVINQTTFNPDTFEDEIINSLEDAGEYDVVLVAGASYQTKRQEMADFMMQSLQYAPMYAPVILPEIMKNMDAPGAQELAEKMYKLMPPEMRAALTGQPIQEGAPPGASMDQPPPAAT